MQEKNKENDILLIFSKNLKRIRNEHKYTQLYVSVSTGIDISLYQKYESNTPPNIKFVNLVKLKEFFNVSLDEFLKIEK